MPYYCTVPRCTSMAGKAKNVSFHQFPRDEELAKLWNKILKRGKPYTKYSKVCSLHFTPEDYTITSVGKNKGQWRTLRKDAIPSQNLPSESPTPYQRKQWGSWSHSTPANNVLDPTIQQQVAQAIYMQTMLAMQAVGAAEMPALNPSNGLPQLPVPTESLPHSSNTPDTDILKGKQTNTNEKSTSYKCTECSKCFKDPDVFMLHKRSHEKNEKENFNLNVTLQANPILANLLKTNTENSNIFDSNVFSMENLLMTALAANMEGYMRSFASMIKHEDRSDLGHDRGDLSHDRGSLGRDRDDLSHDRGSLGRDRDDLSHDRGSLGCDRDDLNHDRGTLGRDRDDLSHDRGSLSRDRDDSSHDRDYLSRDNTYGENRMHHYSGGSIIPNGVHSSQKGSHNEHSHLDSDNGTLNHDGGDISHDRGKSNRDRTLSTNSNESNSDIGANTNTEVNGRDLFREKIIELYRNNDNDRNIRYYENDEGGDVTSYDDRGAMSSDRAVMSDDRVCNGVTNGDNDSQGVDGPVCDSDLNESIDSNNLVIDETF